MRVTNEYMSNNLLKNLNNNMKRLDKYNKQLSTGKKFTLPYENPAGTVRSMRLKSSISNNKQYVRNLENSISWVQNTDSALGQANQVMQRTRELAVRGANGSLSTADRKAIADEVEQLRESLTEVANTTYNGKYIFAGNKTLSKPYPNSSSDYQGDGGAITREIAQGTEMAINQTGKFFKKTLDTMDQLVTDLNNGNTDAVGNDRIEELDNQIDSLLRVRSEMGAKQNRLELTKNRLEEEGIQFEKLLSENEDVDIAKAITNLKMSENVYRAALSSGARIIQPNLMQFLS